ncbi:T cell receptor delta constant [Amia ocellicauda]|uniref:T cell receptor delta constant n=1 Tax=Amia ocellicauda TaxID=2972642 RepID=UPI003464AD87
MLYVNPKTKDKKPSLSLMVPYNVTKPEACLASEFFPRSGNMVLSPTDTKPVKNAPLSMKQKVFYFVGISENEIENCELQEVKTKRENTNKQPATVTPPEEVSSCNGTSPKTRDKTDYPKINFVTLTVNGLRMVFAKTVTFNVLMTVRAMVF